MATYTAQEFGTPFTENYRVFFRRFYLLANFSIEILFTHEFFLSYFWLFCVLLFINFWYLQSA